MYHPKVVKFFFVFPTKIKFSAPKTWYFAWINMRAFFNDCLLEQASFHHCVQRKLRFFICFVISPKKKNRAASMLGSTTKIIVILIAFFKSALLSEPHMPGTCCDGRVLPGIGLQDLPHRVLRCRYVSRTANLVGAIGPISGNIKNNEKKLNTKRQQNTL